MNSKSILTICVNYKNDIETANFLKNILLLNGYMEQTVLVVNNSHPLNESPNILLKYACDHRVIVKYSKNNLGYFGGANWGLQEYLRENILPEWIIISNTDIEFPDRDLFIKLSSYYDSSFPAVIAPDIKLQSNIFSASSFAHQNPYLLKRPSRKYFKFMKWITTFYPLYISYDICGGIKNKIVNNIYKVKNNDTESRYEFPLEIYAPFGAFIIFHRSYFENNGNLGHGVFLFGEEIYIAEKVRELEMKVIYDNRLQVIHNEHSSLMQINSRKKAVYTREAVNYLLDNYF